MSALSTLHQDHHTIRSMLEVLDASVDRLLQGRYVDLQMIAGILRFFDEFVARCHQTQEETALFPVLTQDEQCAAMVPALIRQHACQREALRLVTDALPPLFERLEPRALEAFKCHARAYGASVRAHLFIEDAFLTDLAAKALTPRQDQELLQKFVRIERAAIGPTGREWYNQLAADYRDITATWGHWPDVAATRYRAH